MTKKLWTMILSINTNEQNIDFIGLAAIALDNTYFVNTYDMEQHTRFWYFLHRRAAKTQMRLRSLHQSLPFSMGESFQD